MKRVLRLAVILSLIVCTRGGFAMKITSSAPGNLFIAGSAMKFTVGDAKNVVHYTVTDYFGRPITEGTSPTHGGAAEILLAKHKPGWYQLTCSDGADTATASAGVVINRGRSALPVGGRVCTDVASAWLIRKDEYRKPFAKIIRTAGIPCVRERLSWNDVEAEPDKYDWGKYQAVADTLSAEGIHVDQIWHDSPEWAHPGHTGNICPDDLRTVYRFAKAAASHFAPQVQSWEVWNEPDIFFWPQLGDRFAGLQKAAYLGIKDGNPKASVLNGAICAGVTDFVRNIYESGIGDYFDTFNWHTYAGPPAYGKQMKAHLDLLRQYGLDKRLIWLTECGIRLKGIEGEGSRFLSLDDQRKQCQFVPRSASLALAAGTDRYFFFVTPEYLENGVQFGVLRDDLTPNPAFIALSAAANILGQSAYLGEFNAGPGITALAFSTPRGNVVVAWSDKETELVVPSEKSTIQAANIFGSEDRMLVTDGEIRMKVGPDAAYLIDIGKAVQPSLTGIPRPMGKALSNKPSRTVVVGHADLSVDKPHNTYLLPQDAGPFPYTVEIYNFDGKKTSTGMVELNSPVGWIVDTPERRVRVGPMGREVLTFQVTPAPSAPGPLKLTVTPKFNDPHVQPSVSYFASAPASPTPK